MTCHVRQGGHQIVIYLALKLEVPLIRTAYRLMICGKVDIRIVISSRIGSSCNVWEACAGSGENNDRGDPISRIRYIALGAESSANDGALGGAVIGVIAPVIRIEAKSAPYNRIGIELIRESNPRQKGVVNTVLNPCTAICVG